MPTEDERVQIASWDDKRQQVTLGQIPHDLMQGVVTGCQWFGVTDGKPEFIPRYKPLPELKEDERLLPFFGGGQSYKAVDFMGVGHGFPSITIQYLCGYGYSPEAYKHQCRLLESYGFTCCRSRAGADDRYLELWFLSGDWAMKGPLKEYYDNLPADMGGETKWSEIIKWLCRHARFGTLDVCCQRAAMTME